MSIKLLSEKAINRIAAGEVIERPVSVVKELIENAIDANATAIDIIFARGGRTLISVADNGCSIPKEELKLALQRHATSKIQEDNLDKIEFFGFRGEALPSIAAVGLMTIVSRTSSSDIAWKVESLNKNYDEISLSIAKRNIGTTVELRDIFCFTPNRIKFLKLEAAENSACLDLVKRFALCFPKIQFHLTIDDKVVLTSNSSKENLNLNNLLGEDFSENTINFHYKNSDITLSGYIGLPTFNHPTSVHQYYFVNNRVVKDKLLATAVKIAYADLIPHGRYPAIVLFVDCSPHHVDVNVHPTKSEVRFADEQLIKKLIIDAIRSNINTNRGKQATNIFSDQVIRIIEKNQPAQFSEPSLSKIPEGVPLKDKQPPIGFKYFEQPPIVMPEDIIKPQMEKLVKPQEEEDIQEDTTSFLGYTITQIDNTYIVSLTQNNEVIITDQHAAHERIVLEEMKKQIIEHNIKVQNLLVPEILSYDKALVELLISKKDELKNFGITIERHGISQVSVLTIPALMQDLNLKDLFDVILKDIQELNEINNINLFINHVYGNIACKNSIKANRKLSIEEMNALLRKMEKTPFIEQCNHGRPTYIKISAQDLSKFFERR
ncbi:MAG: DNA mismatch repair endonuclease MutL [Candidatus Midichloria sp.]|nr:DNA mismatch repair endonuclease MutL [Candidatus Midichloria sp.]